MDGEPPRGRSTSFDLMIADDDTLVSDVVRLALESTGQFKVTTAGSLRDLLEKAKATPKPIPDVILLDIVMPGMHGMESIERVVEAYPNSMVVLFSGSTEPEFLKSAIDLGVRGFIPKTLPLVAFTSALHLIKAGQIFVPSTLLTLVMGDFEPSQYGGLTQKEYRVLRCVAAGMRNKEIAWELGISEVSVKMHVRGIFAKLEAKNRTFAVLAAKERGII